MCEAEDASNEAQRGSHRIDFAQRIRAALFAQARRDAWAIRAHGDDRLRRFAAYMLGERLPVQATLVAADQHGHGTAAQTG